jgi:hypothetical protein
VPPPPGQQFNLQGIRARVKDLADAQGPVLSGILTPNTKMTFR